ncbi:hypothetical protein [Salinicoccus roseus]|uniref:hypothetical protein n=1 Tax=Salinicoccus roseus TaxID=45670 RepID=UPI0023003FDF|nr:hypothetical protein [Salinicoccus roseus]
MSLKNIDFYAHNHDSSMKRGTIDLPNNCPWCHSNILPEIIGQNEYDYHIDKTIFLASVLLECPNCGKHFYKSYELYLDVYSFEAHPINENPIPKANFLYPEEVDEICPEFKSIISQTTHAEGLELNHLAGIGYRKSIEFLVKDYLIELKGFDRKSTQTKLLGQCIKDIEDERIKTLAKAATWIGNDETHYTRRHDKSIDDMKKFLHALTLLVSLEKSVVDADSFVNGN